MISSSKKLRHRKKIFGQLAKDLRDINKSWIDDYFEELTELVKEINKNGDKKVPPK